MVLSFAKKTEPDAFLSKHVETERFYLVPCNQSEAIKVTAPWRTNPDTLQSLMFGEAAYSQSEWVKKIGKPDGSKLFYHAIVAKEIKGTIGAHRITLDRSGTVKLAIVVHAEDWWGKGVFEEVRAGLMDHFSQSPRVERFFGRVLERNFSSIYNYKKLGFRLIGHDRKSWRCPATNELFDTLHFEFLKDDWIEKRRNETS